jgi:hypothetical protein
MTIVDTTVFDRITISFADYTPNTFSLDVVSELSGVPRPRTIGLLVVLKNHVLSKRRDVSNRRLVTFRSLPRLSFPMSTIQTRTISCARPLPILICLDSHAHFRRNSRLDADGPVIIQLPVSSWRAAHALQTDYSLGLRRLEAGTTFQSPVRDVLLYTGVNFRRPVRDLLLRTDIDFTGVVTGLCDCSLISQWCGIVASLLYIRRHRSRRPDFIAVACSVLSKHNLSRAIHNIWRTFPHSW